MNPYELAFSDGKYYLVCAVENFEELSIFRVDKLTDIMLLESDCIETEQLKKIKNDKGLQNYIYSQPQLKGGHNERFTLLCYRNALDDVYDAFGNNFRIRTDKIENYDDPDTVVVTVETTREAIKAWAVMHAESVVVISPQEIRDEIVEAINSAQHTYFKSGRPAWIRSRTAKTIDEAIREMRISGKKSLHYTGHGKNKVLEKVDLGKTEISDVVSLSLWFCDVSLSVDTAYPKIHSLSFIHSLFDTDIFSHFPSLSFIGISDSDITSIEFIRNYSSLRRFATANCDNISDFSPLYKLDELKQFETDNQNFTKEEYEKLQKRFPSCKIIVREPDPKRKRKEK